MCCCWLWGAPERSRAEVWKLRLLGFSSAAPAVSLGLPHACLTLSVSVSRCLCVCICPCLSVIAYVSVCRCLCYFCLCLCLCTHLSLSLSQSLHASVYSSPCLSPSVSVLASVSVSACICLLLSLCVSGFKRHADLLLSSFTWGPHFLELNAQRFAAYRSVSSAQQMKALQQQQAALLQQQRQHRDARKQQADCSYDAVYTQVEASPDTRDNS